jgi:hypothetical protein
MRDWARAGLSALDFALASILLAFAIDLVAASKLPNFVQPVQEHPWWFLGAIVSVLGVRGVFRRRTARRDQTTTEPPSSWAHLRAPLCAQVRETWIDGVLVPSTSALPSSLTARISERADLVLSISQATTPLTSSMPLSNADPYNLYQRAQGRLIILGEPGTGKSTMLLRIAVQLLAEAEQTPTAAVPVIFQASSWKRTSSVSLPDWLTDQLIRSYGLPPRAARSYVWYGAVIPLIDGIDELPFSRRAALVTAINEWRKDAELLPMVVSCRTSEYRELDLQLQLRTAFEIQPLTSLEIDSWVKSLGETGKLIHARLESDEGLRAVVTTPLMLTVIVKVFARESVFTIGEAASPESSRRRLLDEYVASALAGRGNGFDSHRSAYGTEEIRHWLGRLARILQVRGDNILYPDSLQADWLPHRWQAWAVTWAVRLLPAFTYFILICAFARPFTIQVVLLAIGVGFTVGGLTLAATPLETLYPIRSLRLPWRTGPGANPWLMVVLTGSEALIAAIEWQKLLRPSGRDGDVRDLAIVALVFAPAVFVFAALSDSRRSKFQPVEDRRPIMIGVVQSCLYAALILIMLLSVLSFLAANATPPLDWSQIRGVALFVLVLVGPFTVWNAESRNVVRHVLLRYLLIRQRLIPRHMSEVLEYGRTHLLLYRAEQSYMYSHDLILAHLAYDSADEVPQVPLVPSRTKNARRANYIAIFGLALCTFTVVDTGEISTGWPVLAGVVGLMVFLRWRYLARFGSIALPPADDWHVGALTVGATINEGYVVAAAERASRFALRDLALRRRLVRRLGIVAELLRDLAVVRHLGNGNLDAIIDESMAYGAFLARENSRPGYIGQLTSLLLRRHGENYDQTYRGVAVYSAYVAYRWSCLSPVSRWLFLARLSHRLQLDTAKATS